MASIWLMVVIKSFVFWFLSFRKKTRIFCDYWEKNADSTQTNEKNTKTEGAKIIIIND